MLFCLNAICLIVSLLHICRSEQAWTCSALIKLLSGGAIDNLIQFCSYSNIHLRVFFLLKVLCIILGLELLAAGLICLPRLNLNPTSAAASIDMNKLTLSAFPEASKKKM